jgi:pimeloyl-ACP methyl ester carboxylesterase
LLHGFPEDWSAWRKVAPRLADRFTVIAPDLRGIGGSTTTAAAFDPATMAQDIAALMSAHGINEAYLVGHDIGGPVAYALARLHPESVRGLMLVESPLEGMPTWNDVRNSPLMWHLGFHQTPALPEQLLAGRETVYVRHFLELSAGGKPAEEADVARYAAAYRAPERLKALLTIYRQLPMQQAFNLAHREPTTIPVTFVGGERVFGPLGKGIAEDLRAWGWSNVESIVVPAAGHYIADEQPNALAALIEARASQNAARGK